MGYSTTVAQEPETGMWLVTVETSLTRAETNALFLSGDSMVSWPTDGLESSDDPRRQRSSMFVSEVAARPEGLAIRYREEAQAERAATILRMQFDQIGIQRET